MSSSNTDVPNSNVNNDVPNSNVNTDVPNSNVNQTQDKQHTGMNIWLKIVLIFLAVVIVLAIIFSIVLYLNPKLLVFNMTMYKIAFLNYYFYDKVFSLKPPQGVNIY